MENVVEEKEVNGLYENQYSLDNSKQSIEFVFKGIFFKIDLSTPDNRKIEVDGKTYWLLVYCKSKYKRPKFYVVDPDNRDNDVKLKFATILGGYYGYLKSAYYAVY